MKPTKQGNGRWKAGVRTATGRGSPRVFKTFDTKAEALRWQTELRAQVQRGAWSAPRDDLTFKQWTDEWLGRIDVSDGTQDNYKAHVKRLAALENYRLGQLRRPILERHLEALTGSARYRAQTHAVLAIILKAAVVEGAILTNPLLGVKPPRVTRKVIQTLTPEQVRRLLLAGDPRYRTALLLAVGTVTDVLKTPSSRRRLPLPDVVLEALTEHIRSHPDADLLFVTPRSGKPWNRTAFNRQVWKPALKAAGLDPELGMHVLRHTYATHLIAEGLHPRVIQARLGHASIVETMDTYGHLFPDAEDSTRSALDSLLGGGSTVGTPTRRAHSL